MALVQGYSSSSEEEDVAISKENDFNGGFGVSEAGVSEAGVSEAGATVSNRIQHSEKQVSKKRTFASTVENPYYDDALLKLRFESSGKSTFKKDSRSIKRKRIKNSDPEDIDFMGPWAKYDESEEEDVNQVENGGEEEEKDKKDQESISPDEDDDEEESQITTEFLGSTEKDYLGRTYMHVPKDLSIDLGKELGSWECFVPKKVIHTFKAHSKGITKLEFFPKSGHLLLSSGNDGKIILWDMYHKREPLRGFYGHKQAVKDICFNSTGSQFLSCSFDKSINLWNTETGEIIKTLELTSIPNTIKFNPNNDNEFIVGLSNHKIEHFDLSISEYETPIRTYDHHMGAINSLTTLDDDKFISTSDDKSVRIWKWNVNIPIKVISSPQQYSMPSTAVHPEGNYFALQSMDNSIQVVHNSGKFKFNKKKRFVGHSNSGYGIGIDISPDGKILMSGDSKGFAYFWDWKTTKIVSKIKINDKLINCIKFHPQETSKVVMAGSTGDIILCD